MLNHLSPWLEYFQNNATSTCTIPWREKETLDPREIKRISKSIATFQLGESSDGKCLLHQATYFGHRVKQAKLSTITSLFIAEEQNHAKMLGQFMQAHSIPTRKKDWTDGLFRKLRQLCDYPSMLSVLVTAELIALVYYKALKNQTGSLVLRCICQKILRDERAHLEFESSTLRQIYAHSKSWRSLFLRQGQKILFAIATLCVFIEHRDVVRAGGYSLPMFLKACWHEHSIYLGAARMTKRNRWWQNLIPVRLLKNRS